MMIATCSGGDTWLTGSSWASDLHDLGFFASRHLVDQADIAIGELLQLLTTAASLVGRDLFLLLEGLDPIHLLTPDIAHRHAGAFGVALDRPPLFPAPDWPARCGSSESPWRARRGSFASWSRPL